MLEIRQAPLLAERTTLHVGGQAIAEVMLHTREDVADLPKELQRLGGVPHILGAGSNILAQDGELPVVLVRPVLLDRPEIVAKESEQVLVRVGAGVRLPRLLGFCALHALGGLEGLSGIPGTVGGAIAMNAGSYGCETCAHLHSVEIFILHEGIRTVTAHDIEYAYRHCRFKNIVQDFIILGATFILTHAVREGIKKGMALNFFKKKSTQPVRAHSAGCVFKNPEGNLAAGKLLELAGFKGRKCAGMAFSELHANFLINEGGGSAGAALDLIQQAQEAVATQFGISLELEVRVMPWALR